MPENSFTLILGDNSLPEKIEELLNIILQNAAEQATLYECLPCGLLKPQQKPRAH